MSQMSVLLGMLREAGEAGVENHELIYRRGITRAASIVFTLRRQGYDIETIDEGQGRLARYVLHGHGRTLPPAPVHGTEDVLAGPATDLRFDCGCVRAATGMAWVSRCSKHETGVTA